MSEPLKKIGPKTQHEPTKNLNSRMELDTGVGNEEFINHEKLRKLAYLNVIQQYLMEEMNQSTMRTEENK